jgi:hypothetical protein
VPMTPRTLAKLPIDKLAKLEPEIRELIAKQLLRAPIRRWEPRQSGAMTNGYGGNWAAGSCDNSLQ